MKWIYIIRFILKSSTIFFLFYSATIESQTFPILISVLSLCSNV